MNRLPDLDSLSFWIGAIVSSIFWAIVMSLRPALAAALETIKKQQQEARLRAGSGIEDSHRRSLYRQTQEMHLAASLFALDEIAMPPRLLPPPAQLEPGMPPYHHDIIEQTLPYLPTWPELGAYYGAPTLSLAEALSGEANLMLTGKPGAGKTTALAYLASQIVNRDPATQNLHERIPFLIHVADLGLPLAETKKTEEVLAPIIEHQTSRASIFDLPRIPGFVQLAFQSGRALLLLDGVDELPQAQVQEASIYLRLIIRAYPQTRIVVAAAPEYTDGMLQLGFTALTLMPWSEQQQNDFLQKWNLLWERYIKNEPWAISASGVDTLLLQRWLGADNLGLTPLEYTLKLWSGYAGDARGSRPLDGIEAHLRRLQPANLPNEALQVLGAKTGLNGLALFENHQATEWLKAFEPQPAPASANLPTEMDPNTNGDPAQLESAPAAIPPATKDQKKNPAPASAAPQSITTLLTISGLLKAHPKNRMRFSHPVFGAYLAGQGLRGPGAAEPILRQPTWSGRTQILHFLAAFTDATPLIQTLLSATDPILLRPQLTAAALLRNAPRNAPWRNTVMAAMLEILQNEEQPLALRAQIMAAFATNGDPSISALFRQLLLAPSNELRLLAALGAGLVRDPKAVENLVRVLAQSVGPTQRATCLALVQIGTPQALEAVATALLQGNEDLRRAAAEALANDPKEGHEALREGIASDDILMRRAIVYGLARIPADWATALLQKTQIEDTQWVVRNVAVELLDNRSRPNPRVPRQLSPPAETPWLVEFAGRQGMGISPGQIANDILMMAFKSENEDEQRAALSYLRHTPSEGIISTLYQLYFGPKTDLRETIYHVLREYAQGGTQLPEPMQYGLG